MPYFLAAFIGWFVSGCLKFGLNVLKYGWKDARKYGGNGGFPSTHTSTLATVAFLIGFGEGWFSPAFGIAIGVLFIVMIDAIGLRNYVGKQAEAINRLNDTVVRREEQYEGIDGTFDKGEGRNVEIRGAVSASTERVHPEIPRLRERMGHTPVEILGGLVVGLVTAYVLFIVFYIVIGV